MPKRALVGGAGLFAASFHAVTTRSQAARSGLTPSNIRSLKRSEVLTEPQRGVLVFAGSPTTWHQRLAIATAPGYGAVGSHGSAARVHRTEGFETHELIEVTVPRGRRTRGISTVRHQLVSWFSAADLISIDGLTVTSLARTIVDIADHSDRQTVERLIDEFERRGKSLAWLEATAARAKRRGFRGANVVLASIDRRRHRRGRVRGSWFEQVIEECLASDIIGPVSAQHELRDTEGQLIGYFDLAVPAIRLLIEAHSRSFHLGDEREAIDERRDNRAALEGWDVRYLGYADATKSPAEVRVFIEQLVIRRRRDLGLGRL